MYHIEESLKDHAAEIKKQNRALAGLREEQQAKQEDLDAARSEQAKSKTKVSQKERKLKKAEKALEAQVGVRQVVSAFVTNIIHPEARVGICGGTNRSLYKES